jgi:hypothetical protein
VKRGLVNYYYYRLFLNLNYECCPFVDGNRGNGKLQAGPMQPNDSVIFEFKIEDFASNELPRGVSLP